MQQENVAARGISDVLQATSRSILNQVQLNHLGNLVRQEEDACLHRIPLTSMHSRVPTRKSLADPSAYAEVVLRGIRFVLTAKQCLLVVIYCLWTSLSCSSS